MNEKLFTKAASIQDLKQLAKSRIPEFVFEYVQGGCNDEVALKTNRHALDAVKLKPNYLSESAKADLSVELFGKYYSAPFGIAPIGLSGLIWPNASIIHAKLARNENIPFILSSVSTASIEEAAEYARNNFWFQLYPPKDFDILIDILQRAEKVGCENLVITIDVPSASWRPKDIKNGLTVPPRTSLKNIFQAMGCPAWSVQTLQKGLPRFGTLTPYTGPNTAESAQFVRHQLRRVVDEAVIKEIRDFWQGNLIIKGINSLEDAKIAEKYGADGIIVSNHGGRQLDAAESPIKILPSIVNELGDKLEVMVDSGVESGIDIGRYLACGAKMVFAGRAFAYGVGAFGQQGGDHAYTILYAELLQLLEQLHCQDIEHLPAHLIK